MDAKTGLFLICPYLNYTIELFYFLSDGTKRLLSGNEKQKSEK